MRYTLAAFAILASAVFAGPVALDTTAGHVAARGTANTNAVNWNDYGYSSYDDWKKKGGWKDYATWKKYAEEYCPWDGYSSWDDWWSKDGYNWWRKISGDKDNEWDHNGDFDSWFKKDGYKTTYLGKDGNSDWYQDKDGVGWHKKDDKWVKDDDYSSSWGKSDVDWETEDEDDWKSDDEDNEWFKDKSGQGWHKSKPSGKWEKDTAEDSDKWKKGSNGKWSKGSAKEEAKKWSH
ncbi:hypothetical protein P171DRAFT_474758 [Karstenula rhodostoma CBS 690.94]|uniref:Uncharacterized protein n=1 Tax=Karstenula rhodostoma CBS 690.94 TaxID=1392251 RepID=A0A9P4U9P7_9PLEO|nr:hypothetical protein P171DRAFT_474758 [Karstenula rhodostoma CBS 690.94]